MKKMTIAISAAAMLLLSCGAGEAQRPPNVLLVVVDALRADHLSCYGYPRSTTPSIDSLAAAGTRWTRCTSQAPWTLPSFASILTGTTVRSHGAGRRHAIEYGVGAEAAYLPDLLREMGYDTYAHLNVSFIDERHGFARGFGRFSCEKAGNADADQVVDGFMEWNRSREGEAGFFALLHLFDPHQHYRAPGEYETMFGPDSTVDRRSWNVDDEGRVLDPENLEHYRALYDGEIAFADAQLRRLFAYLRSRGLADNTVVVVMADHGEEFLDHGGCDHGHTFYEELLHVPLVISGPGVAAGKVDSSRVGSYDVAPTLLGLAGGEVPGRMEGRDLRADGPARTIPSDGVITAPQHLRMPWLCCVRRSGVKTYRLRDGEGFRDLTTDLSEDPGEHSLAPGGDSALVDGYMASPRLWEPLRVGEPDRADPMLRDIGYF